MNIEKEPIDNKFEKETEESVNENAPLDEQKESPIEESPIDEAKAIDSQEEKVEEPSEVEKQNELNKEKTFANEEKFENSVFNIFPTPKVDTAEVSEEEKHELTESLLKEAEEKHPKSKRIKLKYRTKENDINYLGPLSYRYLRLIAWLFLAISQIGTVLNVLQRLDNGSTAYNGAINFISYISVMPVALFLLANFGIVLRNRHNFKYLFVFYGGLALGLYFVANFVVFHYVWGLAGIIEPGATFQSTALLVGEFLGEMGAGGYFFNIFIDMFLCVLTVFFVFYKPKSEHFSGKKIYLFRAMVFIPIAYEITSLVIKNLIQLEQVNVPSYLFFLLTSKPTLTFVAFLAITIILKVREYKFLKKYNNNEELLKEHESTNAHSFRTSITMSVIFAIVSVIDILVLGGYFVAAIVASNGDESLFNTWLTKAEALGLGSSSSLLFIIPFVLLYSYTRVHKNKKLDSFVPLIGIGLVIFTLFEASFLALIIRASKAPAEASDLESSLEAIKMAFPNIFMR